MILRPPPRDAGSIRVCRLPLKIAQANGLADPDKIKVGMELKIPRAA